MATKDASYPAKLDIDYQETHDRMTSFARIIWVIPIFIVLALLTGSGSGEYMYQNGKHVTSSGGGILSGLAAATALMILFRQRYPRWWFDFALELNRFSARVGAYLFLLTDVYPSTVDKQSIHMDIQYPNVEKDLSRWLPLVKWLLAIPHYVVLVFLVIAAFVATVIAWFAILFTGRYPKDLFEFVVGVGRWSVRVNAYAFMMATDQYPPFSLK
jgi:hypothetical protein